MAKNIEMQYYSGSAYEICYPKTLSTQVIMADSTTLEATITSLKTSVSEGKSAIASAITNKGVSTASTATFSTMATNISKISGSIIYGSVVAQNSFSQKSITFPNLSIEPSFIIMCTDYAWVNVPLWIAASKNEGVIMSFCMDSNGTTTDITNQTTAEFGSNYVTITHSYYDSYFRGDTYYYYVC